MGYSIFDTDPSSKGSSIFKKKERSKTGKFNGDVKLLVQKFIDNTLLKIFSSMDIFNSISEDVEYSTIKTYTSRLCENGVFERVKKGYYKKSKIKINDISQKDLTTTPTSRFVDKNGENKIFISDMQYEKVSNYFQGDSLILCGPNVDLRIRQSLCITGEKHNLYLIDNNQDIFQLILNKIPEYSNRIIKPILCNVADLNHSVVFQDLDFTTSWVHKDSQKREAGEILSNRLIKQASQNYIFAAMNFTFCTRGFKKVEVVRAINSALHVLGASVKSFDGSKDGYKKGKKVLINPKKGFGYYHSPDWLLRGRIVELDFYTYSDTSNQMMTCLIIYNN